MAYLTGAARQGVARTAAYYREQRALLLSHCCDGVMHFHCVDTSSGRDAQTLLHEIDGTRDAFPTAKAMNQAVGQLLLSQTQQYFARVDALNLWRSTVFFPTRFVSAVRM